MTVECKSGWVLTFLILILMESCTCDFGEIRGSSAFHVTHFSLLAASVSFVHYFISIDAHAFLLAGIPIRVSSPPFLQHLPLNAFSTATPGPM